MVLIVSVGKRGLPTILNRGIGYLRGDATMTRFQNISSMHTRYHMVCTLSLIPHKEWRAGRLLHLPTLSIIYEGSQRPNQLEPPSMIACRPSSLPSQPFFCSLTATSCIPSRMVCMKSAPSS